MHVAIYSNTSFDVWYLGVCEITCTKDQKSFEQDILSIFQIKNSLGITQWFCS